MTDKIFQIGNTNWYVLVDIEKEEILDKYHKPQLEATIAAIQEQLASYPDPSTAEEDMQALIWLVDNFTGASKERKDRVKALIRDMWNAYQDEPNILGAAELRARLEKLQNYLAQME